MAKKRNFTNFLLFGLSSVLLFSVSFAIFTDFIDRKSTFTVGNVKIELYETSLHRTNNGMASAGRWSMSGPGMDGAAGTAPDDAGWGGAFFTDAQIIESAGAYDAYVAGKGTTMIPGHSVMKCPYVYNSGKSDAYVRIRVLVPTALDGSEHLLDDAMYDLIPIEKGYVTLDKTSVVVDHIRYNQYAFTFENKLKPEEMTFWNVWSDVKVAENITSEQIQALIDSGDLDPTDSSFDVLIQADAVQSSSFDTAAEAFVMFDGENQ